MSIGAKKALWGIIQKNPKAIGHYMYLICLFYFQKAHMKWKISLWKRK